MFIALALTATCNGLVWARDMRALHGGQVVNGASKRVGGTLFLIGKQ